MGRCHSLMPGETAPCIILSPKSAPGSAPLLLCDLRSGLSAWPGTAVSQSTTEETSSMEALPVPQWPTARVTLHGSFPALPTCTPGSPHPGADAFSDPSWLSASFCMFPVVFLWPIYFALYPGSSIWLLLLLTLSHDFLCVHQRPSHRRTEQLWSAVIGKGVYSSYIWDFQAEYKSASLPWYWNTLSLAQIVYTHVPILANGFVLH